MSLERTNSGTFVVNLDLEMLDRYKRGYSEFTDRLAKLPTAWLYNKCRNANMACIQAVELWKETFDNFLPYRLGDQWFHFNREIIDDLNYPETGQDMLSAHMGGSDDLLVVDVAGYLFGFPHERMLIAAGSLEYIGNQVSRHYCKRYPNIKATPALRKSQ